MPPRKSRVQKVRLSRDPSRDACKAVLSLPVELLDIILGLVEDNATLRACMLVSRTLHIFTRPYLFSSLRIARNDNFLDLAGIFTANREIASMVRSLKLEGVPRYPSRRTRTTAFGNSRPNFASLCLEDLCTIIHLLPRLQELTLVRVAMPEELPEPAFYHQNNHMHIRRLTIDDCRQGCHGLVNPPLIKSCLVFTLLSFISADIVDVSRTRLCHTSHYAPCSHSREPPPSPVPVRELVLGATWSQQWFVYGFQGDVQGPGEFYASLQRSLSLDVLESLSLSLRSMIPADYLPMLGAVVQGAAASLVHLDLGLMLGSIVRADEDMPGTSAFSRALYSLSRKLTRSAEHWRVLNLGACKRLESFAVSLRVPMNQLFPGGRPLAAACVALFSTLPPTVRGITVALLFVRALSLLCDPVVSLDQLDNALADREAYPSLRRVRIVVEGRADVVRGCEGAVGGLMPKLKAENALEVVCDPYTDM